MATNGVRGKQILECSASSDCLLNTSLPASSVASSTGSSFVDASGYKFSKDDQKVGKVKLKRPTKKKANEGMDSPQPVAESVIRGLWCSSADR